MEVKILDHIPLSGQYEEISFDCLNDCTWILFSNQEESDEWIGKFGIGSQKLNNRVLFPIQKNLCFVLSGGQGYLINVLSRQVQYKTKDDWYEDCIYAANEDVLLITDGLAIYYFDLAHNKTFWRTGRVSWDGIEFREYVNGVVKGRLNDLSPCGCEFELLVSERILTCSYNVSPPNSF